MSRIPAIVAALGAAALAVAIPLMADEKEVRIVTFEQVLISEHVGPDIAKQAFELKVDDSEGAEPLQAVISGSVPAPSSDVPQSEPLPDLSVIPDFSQLRQPEPEPVVVMASGTRTARQSPEQWRPLVASIFPEDTVDAALSVMSCESGGNPDATGAAGEVGLMQIHPTYHPDASYDPEANLRAAYRISAGGRNWSAWTCRP